MWTVSQNKVKLDCFSAFFYLLFTNPIITRFSKNVIKKRDFLNYCILIDVFLLGAISLSNSLFSLFQMCFSQHSGAEFYFLFLFLLTTSPAFKRLGDTCSTCWNGCCLYRDQNNWKPDKYLTEEVLFSK